MTTASAAAFATSSMTFLEFDPSVKRCILSDQLGLMEARFTVITALLKASVEQI